MTFTEFNKVMHELRLNYSIGVILNLESAADKHHQADLLTGKNDNAAVKASAREIEYLRFALYTAIDETSTGAVSFESNVDAMKQDDVDALNEIIRRWNRILAKFGESVPEIK